MTATQGYLKSLTSRLVELSATKYQTWKTLLKVTGLHQKIDWGCGVSAVATIQCTQCNKDYVVPRHRVGKSKFCSKECHDDYQRRNQKDFTCSTCGVKFKAKFDHGAPRKFCSNECRCKDAIKPETMECPTCGNLFVAQRSSHGGGGLRKYCSKKCADEAKLSGKLKNCVNCGKEFYMTDGTQRQRREDGCCSRECALEQFVGKASPSWKGGRYVNKTGVILYVGKGKYLHEHRVVAARCIGRKLEPYEVVIHLDGINTNNAPENLYICGSLSHAGKIHAGTIPRPSKTNVHTYK